MDNLIDLDPEQIKRTGIDKGGAPATARARSASRRHPVIDDPDAFGYEIQPQPGGRWL
jgi:hypothetical protein